MKQCQVIAAADRVACTHAIFCLADADAEKLKNAQKTGTADVKMHIPFEGHREICLSFLFQRCPSCLGARQVAGIHRSAMRAAVEKACDALKMEVADATIQDACKLFIERKCPFPRASSHCTWMLPVCCLAGQQEAVCWPAF